MSRPAHLIDAIFTERSDDTRIQLIRYAAVGLVAFAVDFGSLVVLTEQAGLHYLTSAAIGFLFGVATNYALSIRWVFNQRSLDNQWGEFTIFALIGVLGLGWNQLLLWLFTEQVQLHYTLSKIGATGFVFAWNFLVRKLMLFR